MIDLGVMDFELGDMTLVNFINISEKENEMIRNWRNSEGVRKWMYSDHVISKEEHLKFIEKLKQDKKNFYWLMKFKGKEDYYGVIYLNKVDLENRNAYLGIYSNQDGKTKRAGGLLLGALKKFAFNIINLHTLKLEVIEDNERAIKFYKKSGFNEEGRLKEFIFRNGKWHDVIVMGILNKDEV